MCIEESFDTIFNMGYVSHMRYGSGQSPMPERGNYLAYIKDSLNCLDIKIEIIKLYNKNLIWDMSLPKLNASLLWEKRIYTPT